MKLYSYVVEHDNGFAPNPYFNVCSLAHCKFGKKRKNIVEMANVDDWIIGTGGSSSRSAGKGKLVYAMRVDEKLSLKEYYKDKRFNSKKPNNSSFENSRGDNKSKFKNDIQRFVLLSSHYYYFGNKAVKIPTRFRNHKTCALEKKGPGYKSSFDEKYILNFVFWLEKNYSIGIIGVPCNLETEEMYFTDKLKKKNGVCK